MRQVHKLPMELGAVGIEKIELNRKSRDDIPALLPGLPYLYADASSRSRLFALREKPILPGVDHSAGRPGMELWKILVLGGIKQGPGGDLDRGTSG